ncbi:MAG TPA: tetratricopeptide repeat protein [bacterium]|nr:tetratricopeptide repeat protein [bacterium]HPQ65598.1 tetratricopeptide repeat protein [bacterium]
MRALIWASLLLAVPGEPAAASGQAERTWWALAEEAAGAGDYGRALEYISRLEAVGRRDPGLDRAKNDLLCAEGHRLLRRKNYDGARSLFLEALDRDPTLVGAWKGLGVSAYFRQEMTDSLRAWEKVLALAPGDRDAAEWSKRVRKESRLEGDLDSSRMGNFIFRYETEMPADTVGDLETFLHQAYREVGYDFNYYPDRPVVVILYPPDRFRRLHGTPGWVAGLYDGKIRLPSPGGEGEGEDFKRILWHEYTHVAVHDLSGGKAPIWLQEGLAQYEENKVIPVEGEAGATPADPIPWDRLDASFSFAGSAATVRSAYRQAWSLVSFLIDEYGFWRINSFLERLQSSKTWKEAFADEFLISAEDFEDDWERSR